MPRDNMFWPKNHRLTLNRRQLIGGATGSAFAMAMVGHPDAASIRVVRAQDGGTEFHGAWPYQIPPAGHFNLMQGVTNGILLPPNMYADLIIQPLALYYWATGEWMPLLATDWGFESGDTFRVTLRDGVRWSDGNELTADDVVATFWVARIMSNTVWQYIDQVTAIDSHTISFHMFEPSTVVERYVLRFNILSQATYGEWAQRSQEYFGAGGTTATPEGRQLIDEFTSFRPNDVIASGPFMFDLASISNARLTLVKNENAWNADQVAFDRIVLYNGETPDVTPVVLAGDVDYATHAFPPATEQQFLASGIRVIRPPLYSGAALYFNYNRHGNIIGDKRVRQALAMAIDRNQSAIISLGDSGVPVQDMTGMSDNYTKLWLTEEDAASLNHYEYDPDGAAAILEELGWTKDEDVWVTPEGLRAEFELSFPAEFADYSATGLDLADQLTRFGFQITPRAVTFTQQPVDVDQGNFGFAIRPWGNSSNPHPHFSYTQAFFTHNTLAINAGGEGMGFPLIQQTDTAGEVDLERLTLEAAAGLDEQAQRENVTTVAKVFNELLPIIPLYERYGNNPVLEGVRVQPWPPDDDPIYENSPYADGIVTMLMLDGRLQPV